MYLRGTLTLFVEDAQGTPVAVAALLSCTLTARRAALPAAHPGAVGWDYYVPGTSSWSAQASLLQPFSAGVRAASVRLLESAFFEGRVLSVTLEMPGGAGQYAGEALITELSVGGSEGAAYAGSYALQGVGELVLTEATGCGQQIESGGSGTTETEHDLGVTAGWVRLDYEMFGVPDGAELVYDGTVVATTGGPVSGSGSLYYNYQALPGSPTTITVRILGNQQSTNWNYTLQCPSPGNAPP